MILKTCPVCPPPVAVWKEWEDGPDVKSNVLEHALAEAEIQANENQVNWFVRYFEDYERHKETMELNAEGVAPEIMFDYRQLLNVELDDNVEQKDTVEEADGNTRVRKRLKLEFEHNIVVGTGVSKASISEARHQP